MNARHVLQAACAAALAAAQAFPGAARAQAPVPAVLRIHAGAGADGLGWSVARIGDLNGDGAAEYAAGEPFHSPPGKTRAGRVIVYDGRTGAVRTILAGTRAPSDAASFGALFGWSVASAGDVDGDGLADIAVGEPGPIAESNPPVYRARAYVFSGKNGALLRTFSGEPVTRNQPGTQYRRIDGFGFAVAGVGDADGDRVPDVVVGAPTAGELPEPVLGKPVASGKHYLYSGATGAPVRAIAGEVSCDTSYCEGTTHHGASVAGVGDWNGDGRADYAVGEPLDADASGAQRLGRVRVFSGKEGAELAAVSDGLSLLGKALASAGDVNGDGAQDLLAPTLVSDAATGATTSAARVYLGAAAGPPGLKFAQAISARGFDATGLHEFAGRAASLGDYDGNGTPELLVGEPERDGLAGPESGAAAAVDGATGETRFLIEGLSAKGRFGHAVAALGDLTGDGLPEFAVSEISRGLAPADLPLQGGPVRHAVRVYTLAAPCADADGDGYGTGAVAACPKPGKLDCDDGNALVHPDQAENPATRGDDNCNGTPLCGQAPAGAGAGWGAPALLLGALALLRLRRLRRERRDLGAAR